MYELDEIIYRFFFLPSRIQLAKLNKPSLGIFSSVGFGNHEIKTETMSFPCEWQLGDVFIPVVS